MPNTEKITYEIDPHNRLIAKKTTKASGVVGFRKVLDGKFSINKDNSLIYHVKKSDNSDIPQQIKFSGGYSLDKDHNLIFTLNKWNNQVEANRLEIKAQFLDAKDNELAFSVTVRDSAGNRKIYIIKLNGAWQADKYNRLSFGVTREDGLKDNLTLQGAWQINDNSEIIYSYAKANTLIFKGSWNIAKNQRITYVLNKKINSGFDFSGKWRLNKKFGLFFEAPFKGARPKNILFGADCSFGENNTVEFKLKNKQNEDMDISLKLSRNILKGQGEAFAQALKEGKELALLTGVGFRW